MKLPIPMFLIRAGLRAASVPGLPASWTAVESVTFGPTRLTLVGRDRDGRRHVVEGTSCPRLHAWLPVLAPILRVSHRAGLLRVRPHLPGLAFAVDAFLCSRRARAGSRVSPGPSAPAVAHSPAFAQEFRQPLKQQIGKSPT